MPAKNNVRRIGVPLLAQRKFPNVPPQYKDELCLYILSELGDGRSLGEVCNEPGMPSAGVVAGWALRDQTFARLYIFARRKRAIVFAEQIIDIADDDTADDKTRIGRAALRIKSRQWVIERDLVELFGDSKERELKPLAVLSAPTEEQAQLQISNDPQTAAREYSKIMGAANVGAAFVAAAENNTVIDEQGFLVGAGGAAQPDVSGYIDEEILASVDPEYESPDVPPDGAEDETSPVDDRPKFAEYYDPKRPDPEEHDVDILPD